MTASLIFVDLYDRCIGSDIADKWQYKNQVLVMCVL